jgi:hypothetical protein
MSAVPSCAASMGCLCAGHSRGLDAADACDTSEIMTERVMRAVLARREVCDDDCPGWVLDGETLRVVACDACRRTPDGPLYDDKDVQILPEARSARVQAMCQSTTRGRQIYSVLWSIEWRGYFGPTGRGCHMSVQRAKHYLARRRQLIRERGPFPTR